MNDRAFIRFNPPGEPKPGFYKVRGRRAGPWLPAQIIAPPPLDPETGEILDRSTPPCFYEAYRDGARVDILDIWIYGRTISEDEWKWLTALQAIRKR